MNLFVKITAVVAVGICVLVLLGFLLKVLVFAAVVAALVMAGLWIAGSLRRRRNGAVVTYTARR